MYEFTGDEEWGCYKTAAENSKSVNCFIPRMFFAELVGEKTDKRNSNKLSTHFPFTYLGQGDCNYRDGNGIYYNSTQPFMITTNKVKDVNEWKSYLEEQASKKTPLTIIYELEKSIYEPISLPNIGTKVGTNNFTIESNIPPSQVTLQYYKK